MRILRSLIKNIQEAVVFGPLYPLRHFAKIFGIKKYSVRTTVGEICLRTSHGSDASCFYHIFVRKSYDIDRFAHAEVIQQYYEKLSLTGRIPVIIDAGANVGAASIWFSRRYPTARVVAVEPDSANASMARYNTSTLPNVMVVEASIGGSAGYSATVSDVSGRSDRIQSKRVFENDGSAIRVVTVDFLVNGYGATAALFIVKIDIEGFESDLFEGDISWVKHAPIIEIELHDWMFPTRNTSASFFKAIAAENYSVLVSGDTLVCVNRTIVYDITT